jgi:hypothetical protein
MIPMINGVSYSNADVILNIMGQTIAGVIAIKYDSEQEKKDNYGAGQNAVARTYGQKKHSGSITLDVLEVESLQAAAPNGDITKFPPFEIPVCYLNSAGLLVSHKLKFVEFTKNMRDTKSGDMEISVELPLIIGDIDWKA